MVNANVAFSSLAVPQKFTQTITSVQGALDNYHGTKINPLGLMTSPDGTGQERRYLASVATSGNAGPINPRLHYRSIEMRVDPISFTNFFTLVRIGIDNSFQVVPRVQNGNTVTYDMFFSFNDIAGIETSLNLDIQRVLLPQDDVVEQIASVPNITDPIHIAILFRGNLGAKRAYDVVTLSVP